MQRSRPVMHLRLGCRPDSVPRLVEENHQFLCRFMCRDRVHEHHRAIARPGQGQISVLLVDSSPASGRIGVVGGRHRGGQWQ